MTNARRPAHRRAARRRCAIRPQSPLRARRAGARGSAAPASASRSAAPGTAPRDGASRDSERSLGAGASIAISARPWRRRAFGSRRSAVAARRSRRSLPDPPIAAIAWPPPVSKRDRSSRLRPGGRNPRAGAVVPLRHPQFRRGIAEYFRDFPTHCASRLGLRRRLSGTGSSVTRASDPRRFRRCAAPERRRAPSSPRSGSSPTTGASIPTSLTWGANAAEVLQIARSRAHRDRPRLCGLLDPNNTSTRFDAVMQTGGRDSGDGVPYQTEYCLNTRTGRHGPALDRGQWPLVRRARRPPGARAWRRARHHRASRARAAARLPVALRRADRRDEPQRADRAARRRARRGGQVSRLLRLHADRGRQSRAHQRGLRLRRRRRGDRLGRAAHPLAHARRRYARPLLRQQVRRRAARPARPTI